MTWHPPFYQMLYTCGSVYVATASHPEPLPTDPDAALDVAEILLEGRDGDRQLAAHVSIVPNI
jgi:hypothetical protein